MSVDLYSSTTGHRNVAPTAFALLIGLLPTEARCEFGALMERGPSKLTKPGVVQCPELVKVRETTEQVNGGLASINRYVLRLGGTGKDRVSVPFGVIGECFPSGASLLDRSFGSTEIYWRIVGSTGEHGMQSRRRPVVFHSEHNFPVGTFHHDCWAGIYTEPRTLGNHQGIAGSGQLPLENKSRPESSYHD